MSDLILFPPVQVKTRRYRAEIARTSEDVREAQRLRHRIFAGEMGAKIHSLIEGLDCDALDDYCHHLLVKDQATGEIVACTRLLSDEAAQRYGRFYSESEFNLDRVLSLPGRFLEIGRTCVDPSHRGSVVMSILWNGLAEFVYAGGFNYLMGCASIPPGPSGFAVEAVYNRILPEQRGSTDLQVSPRIPVPAHLLCTRDECGIPPLLQAYLRQGCWVLGEPCYDEDFNVMDLFILLDLSRLNARYEKRFIQTKTEIGDVRVSGLV
jgi:putative hemolysin